MSVQEEYNRKMQEAMQDHDAELHHDLAPYVNKDDDGFTTLKHPIMFQVPYMPQLAAMCNLIYEQKKAIMDKAHSEDDWDALFIHTPRAMRWDLLSRREESMTDKEFAERFIDCWTDSENIWQYQWEIEDMISYRGHAIKQGMSDRDRDFYDNEIPNRAVVYRGCQRYNKQGWSWTLDRQRAIWFANRFNASRTGILIAGKVNKADILFATQARGEAEVIVEPKNVHDQKENKS